MGSGRDGGAPRLITPVDGGLGRPAPDPVPPNPQSGGPVDGSIAYPPPGAALLIGALLLSAAPAHFQELDRPAGATPENARTHSAERSRPDRDLVIHTVFVPVFRSNSFCRDIQLLLTEAVTKEIEERTRYKVVGTLDEADAILEGTVNTADKNLVVEDPLNLPRPFSAQIVASLALEPQSAPGVSSARHRL